MGVVDSVRITWIFRASKGFEKTSFVVYINPIELRPRLFKLWTKRSREKLFFIFVARHFLAFYMEWRSRINGLFGCIPF